MDESALIVGIGLVAVLIWLAMEIRSLHVDLLPVIRIVESPGAQGIAAALGG